MGGLSHDASVKSFKIATGSAGHVTVHVHNSHALSVPNTPLIIYLPPTGMRHSSAHPPIPPFLLSNPQREYPVAQINYRWDHNPPPPSTDPSSLPPLLSSSPSFNNHPFPTPLHDTLHAFSWLTEEYLPSLATSKSISGATDYPSPPPSPYTSKPKPHPLLIYGTYLGGTLATSLALTESRTSKLPTHILGLIAHNGIFDWTTVATTTPPTTSTLPDPFSQIASHSPLTLPHLHALKQSLFATPAGAFDPFASPTLFFRSPGTSIPSVFPGTSPPSPPPLDIAGLSLSAHERADLLALLGAEEGVHASPKSSPRAAARETTRRSHLKFPPQGSGLKIPRSLFLHSATAGKGQAHDMETGNQTGEMVKLMRRSVVMYEYKDRVVWDEDVDPHASSEERVRIEEVGCGREGERGLGEVVGEWMEELD